MYFGRKPYVGVCNLIWFCLVFLLLTSVLQVQSFDNCSYKAEIERRIDEAGFHRNVQYNITLETDCKLDSCKLCLQEAIPSGLYVNKDQLEDLNRLEKLSAAVDENPDVEAPASTALPHFVRIFQQISTKSIPFYGNVSLPIHVRYHDPQPGGGFRDVVMEKPDLYVYCPGVSLNLSSGVFLTSCAGSEKEPLPYWKVSVNMVSGEKFTVNVPVGDLDNLPLVLAGTYSVVIIGSIYIAGVIYKI